MNKQEAARVLATLAAGFPGTELGVDNAEVWHRSVLRDISLEEGLDIAHHLLTDPNRQSPHSFPKLSEFQAVRRARVRARGEAFRAELDAPTTPPAEAKAHIAAMREKLAGAVRHGRDL